MPERDYRYPFFHWVTGLFMVAFMFFGVLIGVAIGFWAC